MARIQAPEGPVSRLIRHAGLSLAQFQEQFGFSRSYIGYLNRAQLQHVPQSIHDSLAVLYSRRAEMLSVVCHQLFGADLQEAYRQFRTSRRRTMGEKLPIEMPPRVEGESPAAWLARAVGGPATLANWLCMHEYTMREFIAGKYTTPAELAEALEDSGWKWTKSFLRACRAWDEQKDAA